MKIFSKIWQNHTVGALFLIGALLWIVVGTGVWGEVSKWGGVGYASNYYYSVGVRIAIPASLALFGLTFFAFVIVHNQKKKLRIFLVIVETFLTFSLIILLNSNFPPLLLIIISAQIPYLFRIQWGFICILIASAAFYLILEFYWGRSRVHITTFFCFAFQLSTFLGNHYAKKEIKAKENANLLNRELLATQSLLSETARQNERLRIARDIHDLIGHHLTALSINLEIAEHLSEGKAKKQIEKAHAISSLLLSDVREAVSEIRSREDIDIEASLHLLIDEVPKLNISLDVCQNLKISDARIADIILTSIRESITNSLKHSNASDMNITISTLKDIIKIEIIDNGSGSKKTVFGNGLNGMKERVETLDGSLSVTNDNGFSIIISLPNVAHG